MWCGGDGSGDDKDTMLVVWYVGDDDDTLLLRRNNNSSRFGKYFEIFFDRLGRPQGGKIEYVSHITHAHAV